jgi:hypothetical protein
VGEPAFGGVDEAAGIFDASALGPFAGDVFGRVVPGEGGGAFGELFGASPLAGWRSPFRDLSRMQERMDRCMCALMCE